jgi:hypothetical protein
MSGGPGKKNGSDRHGIGGNLGPHFGAPTDPGLGHDFVEAGPVAISTKVIRADRERFYDAIRSQGPEQARRRAIDMAKERARRDKRLSSMAFRVFDAIASWSKWKHRYCWQSMEVLAFASSQSPEHSNVARYVDRLVELGYVVDIQVPSVTGGRHKRYLTVACTAADRTGQTLKDIASEAVHHKVRGAEENQDEITANDDRTSNPEPRDVTGTAIRNPDALPCNSVEAIRNPDVSIRNPDVSIRSPDALTLDRHFKDSEGGVGGARPLSQSVGGHGRLEQEATPHSPPPAESELQHKSVEGGATKIVGLSREAYAIYRSWSPERDDAEANCILHGSLNALTGSNPAAQLEHIILFLNAEHAAGKVRDPGKLVGRRIEQANSRARAGKLTTRDGAAEATAFKSWEELGRVGFGDKVTGADANDILKAVPGPDPDKVRLLIREVCAKWTGSNGATKSRQHVVDEVIRRLRDPDATSRAGQPAEAIRVGKPTKEDAAKLAALAKQMASPRSPTGA